MQRQLLKDLHQYFFNLKDPTEDEKYMLSRIEGELPYFRITSVHRDDLQHAGFYVSNVSDDTMEGIASKLADSFCDNLYWEALPIIAEMRYNISKTKFPCCPKCDSHAMEYDFEKDIYYCVDCDLQWTDHFVLVQFPEDAGYFEQEEIGYPCNISEDNGSRYVPEYEYIQYFQKTPEKGQYYCPVQWPDSQKYMEETDINSCEIIMDEKGFGDFGSSSLWVPLDLIKTKGDNIPI